MGDSLVMFPAKLAGELRLHSFFHIQVCKSHTRSEALGGRQIRPRCIGRVIEMNGYLPDHPHNTVVL